MSIRHGNARVRVALGLAMPILVAAGPPPNGFLNQHVMAEATIGADSQAGPVSRLYDPYTPAPMPDFNHDAPAAQSNAASTPHFSPKLFHKGTTYHGEGYVFGSTVQEQQDRKVGPAPGVNLIMPLQ